MAFPLLLLIIMLKWFEHRQVYAPMREMVYQPSDFGLDHEEVHLATPDHLKLHAWFFPCREEPGVRSPESGVRGSESGVRGPESKMPGDVTLLLLHGNAGNISTRMDYYKAFLELGWNVLALDYRGYGRSEGVPSETGTYQDAQAALNWLEKRGCPPGQVIVLGESLGGGVASEMALRNPIKGLVILNSFTRIPDIGKELLPWLPVEWLSSIRYDTLAKLPEIRVPVMIMHSPQDRLIGIHHGKRNFEAANEPKLFWELKGGHSETLLVDRDGFLNGLTTFLDSLPGSH